MLDLPKNKFPPQVFSIFTISTKKKTDLTITKHLCSFATIFLYLKEFLILKEFYTTNTDKLS